MGLCGSFRCGCGLTSTPATEGAINGELPTIFVAGSGEPGDPFDLTLNDAWAQAVVDSFARLPARIQAGFAAGATSGGGILTVAHGLSWTPDFVLATPHEPNGGSAATRFVGLNAGNVGASTFEVRCTAQDGSTLASTAVSVWWLAVKVTP